MTIRATRSPFIDVSDGTRLAQEAVRTASGSDPALLVTELPAYWQSTTGLLPRKTAIVFFVQKLEVAEGATATIAVAIDDTSGHENSPLDIAGPVQIREPGVYVLPIDVEAIARMDFERGNGVYIATRFERGGSGAVKIIYDAFLT